MQFLKFSASKHNHVNYLPPKVLMLILFSSILVVTLLTGSSYSPFKQELNNTRMPADDLAAAQIQAAGVQGRIQVGEIETTRLRLTYTDRTERMKTIQYPGASYIKVHIAKLDLMPGDTITVSDLANTQVYTYPGSGFTTDGEPGFWAISILGDTAVITIHKSGAGDISIPPQHEAFYRRALAGASPSELGLEIDQFARGYPESQIQSLLYGTESTCGTNQRTDVACYQSSHPTEFDKSHAVARILINGTSLCTAWRASAENRIFTNEHCVSTQSAVSGTEVWFNYQRLTCGGSLASTTIVTGDEFLTDSYDYDFALFTVNNFSSITGFGYLEIDPRTPVLNEEIYIPQHGNGNPKEFGIESDLDTGNVCRIGDAIATGRVTNSDTGYYCDTIGGSSGSPVLARSNHKVIAIHHYGISGSTCSSSNMNQGVRMDLIWPLVEAYFTAPDIGPLVYDNHSIDDDDTGDSSGNNDGAAQCGESIELFVDLLNQGTDSASGVQAVISTSDPYVSWLENTSSTYPDIAGSGTGTNLDDYDLSISGDTPDNHVITFNLDITASSGGPWQDTFEISVDCSPPAAPTSLSATPISGMRVDLAWVDNADDETSYSIERSPDGTSGWTEIDTTSQNTTSYSDTGLDCDSEYFYRVRAYRSDTGKYSGYSNTASAVTYACRQLDLAPGWNPISLPLQPISPYTAQTLLDEINNQGNICSEVKRWFASTWETHTDGSPSNNFPIELGSGYFLNCPQPGAWMMSGTQLSAGQPLDLVTGWNLVGIPYPETGYTAQSLLADINSQSGYCSEVNRWYNSGWQSHLDGLEFNNFSIVPGNAYFLLCSQNSTFTPGP